MLIVLIEMAIKKDQFSPLLKKKNQHEKQITLTVLKSYTDILFEIFSPIHS